MDFDLTDEQELVRRTAREFTDREIWDRARQNARDEHFDVELVKKIADQGYLGAIVPREYGGAGLDYVTYGLVVASPCWTASRIARLLRRGGWDGTFVPCPSCPTDLAP